jgi:hypothetical protein
LKKVSPLNPKARSLSSLVDAVFLWNMVIFYTPQYKVNAAAYRAQNIVYRCKTITRHRRRVFCLPRQKAARCLYMTKENGASYRGRAVK